jgi:hypothetical protein
MVNVSREQLAAVEYLLNQSAQGNHVLFDLETVRRVFSMKIEPMSVVEAREIEAHIEALVTLDSLERQRFYIRKLSEQSLHRVIRMYFNIVENNLFETGAIKH